MPHTDNFSPANLWVTIPELFGNALCWIFYHLDRVSKSQSKGNFIVVIYFVLVSGDFESLLAHFKHMTNVDPFISVHIEPALLLILCP